MRLRYTDRFRRAYSDLADDNAERVKRALRLLADNPRHPGLRVKRVQGTDRIWEARAGLSVRLTFEIEGDGIVLRNVGAHDETLKKP
ncbi:MAG: type II toxin-antitoxin system RelE/ParE family toxin [Acidobacteriota bacterium]|jgi:mRNA-degrading endonuclease RelE of RelBE toxin-antitoxin system